MKMAMRISALVGIGLALGAAIPAQAQEVTTYTYDALGRVVGVNRSGGPVAGTNTAYAYDPASNRTNVTVTNSPNATPPNNSGSGATAPVTKYVIVPLNGFTLIPFQM